DCATDPADPDSFPNASGGCIVTTTTSSSTTTSTTSTSSSTSTSSTSSTSPIPTTTSTSSTSTSTTLPPPITNVQATALRMREGSTAASRRFSFKSTTKLDPPANRIVIPGAGTAGDPTAGGSTGGGAVVTVYNSNGSGEKTTLTLP